MANLLDPAPASETQSVAILLLPAFSNLTLAAVMEPLRAANRAADRALYRHSLLSADGAPVTSSSGLRVAPDRAMAEPGELDLLCVIASFGVKDHLRRPLLDWLRRTARRSRGFAGLESGAYALAAAGLLEGYRATTHWEDLEDFAAAYPGIAVANERFVVDRDRATTGGAIPTLDLVLNLIRHQHGLLLALEVGSTFIYEQDTAPADPQHIVSLGALRWQEPKLSAAIALMEDHLGEPLRLGEIAARVALSERGLQRLFRRRLEASPQRIYLSIRLNAARRLLEQTELSVAEIGEACGFNSRGSFHRAFRSSFGRAPMAFKTNA